MYTTGSTNKPEISSSPTGCQIGPTYLRSTNTIEDDEDKPEGKPVSDTVSGPSVQSDAGDSIKADVRYDCVQYL